MVVQLGLNLLKALAALVINYEVMFQCLRLMEESVEGQMLEWEQSELHDARRNQKRIKIRIQEVLELKMRQKTVLTTLKILNTIVVI